MPYKKFKPRRHKKYKKKTFLQARNITATGKAFKSVAEAAYIGARTAELVKGMINSEKKLLDTGASFTTVNTGSSLNVTSTIQGDDYFNRQGRSIRVKSLQFSLQATVSSSLASGSQERLRIMAVIDTERDGSTNPAAITDILKSANVWDLNNPEPDNQKRFIKLFDKVYNLSKDNGVNMSKIQCDYFKKLDLPVKYNGTSNTEASQAQNAIEIWFLTDEATNPCSIAGTARIRFYDN